MFRNLLKKLFNPDPPELLSPLAKFKGPTMENVKPLPVPVPTNNSIRTGQVPARPVPMPSPKIKNTAVPMPLPQIKNTGVPMPTPTPHTSGGVMYGRNPSTKIANSTARSAIEAAAKQYGVPAALMYDIAMQESSLNPDARNPEPGVTAAGLFQINNPTWDTIHKYGNMPGSTLKLPSSNHMDPNTNAAAAAYLISKGQLGRWDASKNVWGKFWPDDELNTLGFYSQTLKKVANAR